MSEAPCDPILDPGAIELLEKGVAEFNGGRFFEAHDILEDLWRETRGPARAFFQGLIQIAVGFYHLNNGNIPGGQSQLSKGLENLGGYGDRYAGIELAILRHEVREWLEKAHSGRNLHATIAELPKFRFAPP